jgi:F-type H+-transporting ATPase subunit b
MSQLFSQLGIDWRLLISQAVNFLLLLIILRIFLYKPLLKLMHDRRDKIKTGLEKAKMADERLHEIDAIGKGKIKEAEATAMGILKKTELDAKELEAKMLHEAERKEAEAVRNTEALLQSKQEESRRAIEREAALLVRQALVKTVEMSPAAIDDTLIAKAVKGVTSEMGQVTSS